MAVVLLVMTMLFAKAVGIAQQRVGPAVVAEVNGQTITLEELEKSAASDLLNLSLERQRVIATALDRMIAERLLSIEAKARGQTEAQLLQQEVYSKIATPTDDDIANYSRGTPGLAVQDSAKIATQIRRKLLSERRQKAYREFTERLKVKYSVRKSLAPLRLKVEGSAPPARGPLRADVTILEFSDFQCPYSRALARAMDDVAKQYGDKVRVLFRQFPLEQIHADAMRAAEASVCALYQDRFWEMHDRIFSGGPPTEAALLREATDAGLDRDQLQRCLTSGQAAERVRADIQEGVALGVSSTPTFFINGRPMRGAATYQQIVAVIEEELQSSKKSNSK